MDRAAPERTDPGGAVSLDFSEEEIQRYSRHILLPEIGAVGQATLRASSWTTRKTALCSPARAATLAQA